MEKVFTQPKVYTGKPTHFCPGCTHGIVQRLVMEVIDELEIAEKVIMVAGVGCGGLSWNYYEVDGVMPMHGRACAVATGIKRAKPNQIVFTYQGDGDMAAIGLAETMHAAIRGEKITAIMINNTCYGNTGGQMAPTTLVGQRTTTSPYGRDAELAGYPVHMAEMVASQRGSYYVERVAVDSIAHIRKAKAAIKKAIINQMEGKGFSMVEVLSTCPTNWGLTPYEAMKRITNEVSVEFPLGVYKDKDAVQEVAQ